jgi:catalase
LFEKAGVDEMDEGTIELSGVKSAKAFVNKLGKLRIWAREPATKGV